MKKGKKILVLMLIMSLAALLQGCSPSDFSISALTTPSTTHELIKDKYNSKKFEISLTADMTQKYEWYVFSEVDLDKTGEKFRKGMFNDTYYWDYGYMVTEGDDFNVYLILVKDGDLDNSRVFPYHVRLKDTNVIISEEKAFTLDGHPDEYKLISNGITLTTSY